MLQDAGWIDAGTDPDEAVTSHPPHQGRLSWEDVYRGWKSDRYQYHWKRFDLTPVEKVPVAVVEEAV